QYASKGISLFKQTFFGYIPVNIRRFFLTVKLRGTPMELKEARAQLRQTTAQKLSSIDLKISEDNPYTKSDIKEIEIETNSISSRSSTPMPETPNKTSNNIETLVDEMIIEFTVKNTTDIPNETTPKAIPPNNNSMTESKDQDPKDPPFTMDQKVHKKETQN
ncbi:5297_t:CDS:2, partial [Dentiscutata heterogama]